VKVKEDSMVRKSGLGDGLRPKIDLASKKVFLGG
jgi:hypothetical protein